MKRALKRISQASQAASFFRGHQLIIGLLLVFFGVSGSWFILTNFQGTYVRYADWQTFPFYTVWTFSFPVLLVMALVGTLMLSVYCVRDIQPARVDNKEHAAFLVTSLGFAYLIVGAWPFWTLGYFWPWQQQIANYGNLLVLPLYAGSFLAFAAGAFSLYIHSRIYHQQHPELSNNAED